MEEKIEKEKCHGIITKNSGPKPCGRRPHRPGMLYCNKHLPMAIKSSADYDSLGLVPDTWNVITKYLSLDEIRSLYLTCKTLYGHFLPDRSKNEREMRDWFTRNPRYIMIEIISYTQRAEQDSVSVDYKTRQDNQLGWIPTWQHEIIGSQGSSIAEPLYSRHCLFVINSHHKARQLFAKMKRGDISTFQFECRAEDIHENMFNLTKNKICEVIRSKHKLTLLIEIHNLDAIKKVRTMATAVVHQSMYVYGFEVIFFISSDEKQITYVNINSV